MTATRTPRESVGAWQGARRTWRAAARCVGPARSAAPARWAAAAQGGAPARWAAARRDLGAALALAFALTLLPSALTAQLPPNSPEVLRPGDVVRVQVWRQPEFSGEFEVTQRGEIAHPLFRAVNAAGRPVPEVEEALGSFLLDYESAPNFVVQGLFRVAVGGQVRQPGVHLLRPGTTVSEALAQTGGSGEEGRLDRVVLRRGGQEHRLDLTDPAGDARRVTVRSGDEIVVPRHRSILREYVLPVVSFAGSLASIYRVVR